MARRCIVVALFVCGVSGCSPPTSIADAGAFDGGIDAPIDAFARDGGSPSADAGDAADAVALDAGPSCAPYAAPSIATLRASRHLAFAHYFSAFPLSIDNRPPATDYYATQYLQPGGERGAHAYCGGFLRERPLSPAPWPSGTDWNAANMEIEVRRAIALGLDGFAYDVLSVNPTSVHRQRLEQLLAAAQRVDPAFRIQLVLDMTVSSLGGGGGTDATALGGITSLFSSLGHHPSLQTLADGRIVVSAFAAERRSAAFWIDALAQLHGMGFDVAFVPMTIGGWAANAAHFAGVPLYGCASWGGRTVAAASGIRNDVMAAHAAGLVYMAPVAPQDSRPKDLTYVESDNSAAFRAQWDAVIANDADWVQLVTWNDYSEDSEIAPSSETNTAFYDLSAYYLAWWKTGAAPAVTRDALYYFHRVEDMHLSPDLTMQRSAYRLVNGPTASSDEVEVVGLLTAPGTLEIALGGATHTMDVGAGIQSFRVPIAPGTPAFRLLRGGAEVVSLTSASPIVSSITYQDPLYHAGSSTTCAPGLP